MMPRLSHIVTLHFLGCEILSLLLPPYSGLIQLPKCQNLANLALEVIAKQPQKRPQMSEKLNKN